jgi:hypothetical protein
MSFLAICLRKSCQIQAALFAIAFMAGTVDYPAVWAQSAAGLIWVAAISDK